MSARDLRQQCIDWRSAQEGNDRDDALIVVKVGQVEALLDIAEAAARLDTELSEKNSGFDSDGVYDRYVQFRSEEALSAALARLDAIRTTDTSPLTLGASATGHNRKDGSA